MSAEPFEGTIGRTLADSEPWWPEPVSPPGRSPNIVLVVLDDTGYGHFGCYGSDIDTPNIDALANGGLRYMNWHTTALCSSTRACLLTGRNHHAVGMRAISNFDTGFPNMRGKVTPHAATLAEILREHGYATYATGKWHIAPMQDCSQAGPFNNWPLGKGFERFYGFLQGETDQFHPELTQDNSYIDPPGLPEDGYHLSEDLVDRAIGYVRDLVSVRPGTPFFLYTAFGAAHAPHQAPQQYIDKYRGRYDQGWDVVRQRWFERQLELGLLPEGTELVARNDGVTAWDELTPTHQKFACALQEAFAGFLDHTDAQIGRLVEFLREIGELDNTLFIVCSDNGASQEGGPDGVMDEFSYFNFLAEDIDHIVENRLGDIGGPHSHSNYPWGWAQVGNTPLKWYKQNTHGGGVRDPFIIHWPDRITDGGSLRRQFHHAVDVVPTILEELGIEPPAYVRGIEQLPIHGTSMSYTLDAARADEPTHKSVQYFEMFGHRGIWADGWKAVARHWKGFPWNDDEWELYHLDEDFSENRNLAREQPEKLRELADRWWAEAGAHGVLPLDDRNIELFGLTPRPGTPHASSTYTYLPPISHLPADASPRIGGRSWSCDVDINIDDDPSAGTDGVLVATGSHNIGFSLFISNGLLHFDYNFLATHYVTTSTSPIGAGHHTVSVRFLRDDQSGDVLLLIDGKEVGAGRVPQILRMFGSSGMDIGLDRYSSVSEHYKGPFPYSGTISRVQFEILRRGDVEAEREARESEQRVAESRE